MLKVLKGLKKLYEKKEKKWKYQPTIFDYVET